MSVNTGYIVDNENYVNKDLSNIFQPINNYDYGTYKIRAPIYDNLNTYYGFYYADDDSIYNPTQSFTIYTPRNVVSPEFTISTTSSIGWSFLRFSKTGTYKLDMTFNVISGYSTVGGSNDDYSLVNYIKIHKSYDTRPESIPTINILNMSFSGNGSTNQIENGFTSSNNNNNIYVYSTAPSGSENGTGYPVFYTSTYFSKNGTAGSNTRSLSFTFKISELTDGYYDIYPLLAGNIQTTNEYPWLIEGNWMVTKLS
jgi:hypothetical protein